jgi:hypothetical protein
MKRFGVIIALQIVVIAAAAFAGSWAFSRWQNCCPAPAPDEVSWFRSQLGLTPEQAATLEKLHESFRADQSKLCELHCAKRFELGELIQQSDAITPHIEAMTKELSALEAESQRLTIQHIFEVGKQLDAGQRARFVNKVYEQMCTSCPMGSHKPEPGKQASCESAECDCCVASGDGDPHPAPSTASLPSPQTKLQVLTAVRPVLATTIDLQPSREFALSDSRDHSVTPLFVLFSTFRI